MVEREMVLITVYLILLDRCFESLAKVRLILVLRLLSEWLSPIS